MTVLRALPSMRTRSATPDARLFAETSLLPQSDELMKVVNFATRVVTGIRRYGHVSRARDGLGLHTPRQMCDFQTAVVAHKACVTSEPAGLATLLCTYAAARTCERATRQDQHLRPPAMRTAAGQRAFAYRAALLLNTLPDDVRGLEPSVFKRVARRLLLQE